MLRVYGPESQKQIEKNGNSDSINQPTADNLTNVAPEADIPQKAIARKSGNREIDLDNVVTVLTRLRLGEPEKFEEVRERITLDDYRVILSDYDQVNNWIGAIDLASIVYPGEDCAKLVSELILRTENIDGLPFPSQFRVNANKIGAILRLAKFEGDTSLIDRGITEDGANEIVKLWNSTDLKAEPYHDGEIENLVQARCLHALAIRGTDEDFETLESYYVIYRDKLENRDHTKVITWKERKEDIIYGSIAQGMAVRDYIRKHGRDKYLADSFDGERFSIIIMEYYMPYHIPRRYFGTTAE
jgi:hypothetical protein